jgi:hypothetical protein
VPSLVDSPSARSTGSNDGNHADSGSVLLALERLSAPPAVKNVTSRYVARPPPMKFSMIVEITSLTPRVTFSTPAIPAHTAPVTMAMTMMRATCSGPGSDTAAPSPAESTAASRYWPSTPMLNSAIRKPMATASAARKYGTARSMIETRLSPVQGASANAREQTP